MRYAEDPITVTLPGELATLGLEGIEQGGILIGQDNTVQQITRPAHLDLRQEGLFMLIDDHHQQELDASGLDYLGAWHSHPPGTPSEYSTEDLLDWRSTAPLMFEQQPHLEHLFYPIVTGDRLRVWALDRDLNVTELRRC